MKITAYLAKHTLSARIYGIAFLCFLLVESIYLSFPIKIQAETLIVYTSNQQSVYQPLLKMFKDKTGIDVIPVYMLTSEALQHIQISAKEPICDMFWGGALSVLEEYNRYFQKYDSPEKKFIDPKFLNPDSRWYPTNLHLGVLAFNPKVTPKKDVPTSWRDICNKSKYNSVAAGSPETTSTMLNGLYAVACILDPSHTQHFIRKFRFVSDSRFVIRGVASGNFRLGFTLEATILQLKHKMPSVIQAVYPSDGVVSLPEGAAIIRNAPHLKEAQQLMDFLLSKECQQAMQLLTFRRSIRIDVPPIKSMPALSSLYLIQGFSHILSNDEILNQIQQWKRYLLKR